MGDMPSGKITLGRYMWERIHQIGIDTIFGVPGDFNLQFLDSIFHVDGLRWMGNQNELNAAYAADGYARIKGVPGCLVTTHGVGELSALNGIAGSMSEHVKVIHVVGQTTKAMQSNHMMIHHSIGNKPDHQLYNKASAGLRYAAAELWDVETAPAEIDRVIRECFLKSGPVYIFLPLDLSSELVDKSLLDTPIDTEPQVDGEAQSAAVEAITEALKEAKRPTVLIDAWTQRFGAAEEAQKVVQKLHVPWFSANMGKGVVDEDDEMYVGVWNGEVSTPGLKDVAKAADLVVSSPSPPSFQPSNIRPYTDHSRLHSLRHQRRRLLSQNIRRLRHSHQPTRHRNQRPHLPKHIHQITPFRSLHCTSRYPHP
jgi:pyruvate decarboxylase